MTHRLLMRAFDICVSRLIKAPGDEIWEVLADLRRMPELSPETIRVQPLGGGGPLKVGAQFRGRNRLSFLTWSTTVTITALDPGRRITFVTSAPSRSRWTYELEPVPGGTQVTERMTKDEPQPLPVRWLQVLAGVTDRSDHLRTGMATTLARLALAVGDRA